MILINFGFFFKFLFSISIETSLSVVQFHVVLDVVLLQRDNICMSGENYNIQNSVWGLNISHLI